MKLKLILDLDNTIISSIPVEEMEWTEHNKNKSLKFNFHDMEDYYIVYERPHLQDFLDFIFKNFNVSIWSAATKNYVLFILKNIMGENRVPEYILFSYHCDLSRQNYKGTKNLKMLYDNFENFNPQNTLIIDDLNKVKKHNPHNCIEVHPFEYTDKDSEKDDELIKIKEKLEKLLELHKTGQLTKKHILKNI
jgi:TFIIF-interacting CTD phosphatase-like protein